MKINVANDGMNSIGHPAMKKNTSSCWPRKKGVAARKKAVHMRANSFAFGNPFAFVSQSQETPLQPRTIGLSLRIMR